MKSPKNASDAPMGPFIKRRSRAQIVYLGGVAALNPEAGPRLMQLYLPSKYDQNACTLS